jgi:hypothetical protein
MAQDVYGHGRVVQPCVSNVCSVGGGRWVTCRSRRSSRYRLPRVRFVLGYRRTIDIGSRTTTLASSGSPAGRRDQHRPCRTEPDHRALSGTTAGRLTGNAYGRLRLPWRPIRSSTTRPTASSSSYTTQAFRSSRSPSAHARRMEPSTTRFDGSAGDRTASGCAYGTASGTDPTRCHRPAPRADRRPCRGAPVD